MLRQMTLNKKTLTLRATTLPPALEAGAIETRQVRDSRRDGEKRACRRKDVAHPRKFNQSMNEWQPTYEEEVALFRSPPPQHARIHTRKRTPDLIPAHHPPITPRTTRAHVQTQTRTKIYSHLHPRVCAYTCLLYTSPSPRDKRQSRMPSSA